MSHIFSPIHPRANLKYAKNSAYHKHYLQNVKSFVITPTLQIVIAFVIFKNRKK